MSVLAIGVDIAEVSRIQELIERYGDRFVKRVFTDNEIAYCQRKVTYAQSYAARFATKEAIFKALGTGLNLGMLWKDVEVVNDSLGKPTVKLYGQTAKKLTGKQIHLSLSHVSDLAISMIVVETPR